MANKPKTKTRKNRVKVPNVGPGKNISVVENKPVTSNESQDTNTETTNILKPKTKKLKKLPFSGFDQGPGTKGPGPGTWDQGPGPGPRRVGWGVGKGWVA